MLSLKAQSVSGIMNSEMFDQNNATPMPTIAQGNVSDAPVEPGSENTHEPPIPQDSMLAPKEESPINQAALENDRRVSFQGFINSTATKVVATGFLLISLFSASFLVAYQQVEKTRASESLDEIPKAQIILPQPTAPSTQSEEKMCGGIAAIECDPEYRCELAGDFPDASGTCIKEDTD